MMERSFATETAAMRTMPFSSASNVDWSFRIALSLVILFGAAELFSAGYFYVGKKYGRPRPAVASTTTTAPAPLTTTATAPPSATAAPPPAASVAPPPARAISTPTGMPSIAPAVAPTSAPVAAATAPPATAAPSSPPTTALSAGDRLLKEANALRERGDTTSALARLQDAVQRDPKNASVLAQMATIYESINLYERSNEMWRKVEEIGPSAGAVYELAMLKLRKGAEATPAPAVVQPQASVAENAMPAVEGVPEGSTFGIADLTATETQDPDADTNLMVRIAVKKRPNMVVDHTRVKIQVFFYDTVDDKEIKLTDADVSYEWLTPNHDWAGPNPEVLAVTYLRSKNKAAARESELSAAAAAVNPNKKGAAKKATLPPPDEGGRRKYLGYIVRVYYNDKLQAVRADPTKLLSLFPAPTPGSP